MNLHNEKNSGFTIAPTSVFPHKDSEDSGPDAG